MARRSINSDTFRHQNPIPGASMVGPMLTSGFVPAFDPGQRTVPESLEEQVANVFGHIEALLDVAGGTLDDVLRIDFMVASGVGKAEINDAYLARFPDETSRPARSVSTYPDFELGSVVKATFTAYIEP
jgi:2-iminobutanoate/2-iminopropanoate deaminase